MKRYEIYALNLFLVTILLLAVPAPTSAHELPSGSQTSDAGDEKSGLDNNDERKQNRIENREERQADRAQQKQERHEKFHEQLELIKNENKKDAIERINTTLAGINKRYTSMLSTVLSKFEAILARIIEKTHDLADDGTNTAAIDADITDAETALGEAKDAITAQSEKDYTLTITDESTIREVAQAMRRQLHADLKATRAHVQNAHEAIKVAAHTLYETKENL